MAPSEWVDTVREVFDAHGKTGCVFARVGVDDDLHDELVARGFTEWAQTPEMVCDRVLPPREPPPGVTVRLAASAADVSAYAAIAGRAFAHLSIPEQMTREAVDNPDVLLRPDCAIALAELDGTTVAGCARRAARRRPGRLRRLGRVCRRGAWPGTRRRRDPSGHQRGVRPRRATRHARSVGVRRAHLRAHGLSRGLPLPRDDPRCDVAITPAIRDFLVQLDDLVDAHAWPGLDREIVTVGTGDAAVLVRLPHAHERRPRRRARRRRPRGEGHLRARARVVRRAREGATKRSGSSRCSVTVASSYASAAGSLWTTMYSYRDGLARPFRRTRMPWPTLRPRTVVIHFGFA